VMAPGSRSGCHRLLLTGGCLAGRAELEPVDAAAAVEVEADDHAAVADSPGVRASRAGRILDRQALAAIPISALATGAPAAARRRGAPPWRKHDVLFTGLGLVLP
jgi:hypothetical protein